MNNSETFDIADGLNLLRRNLFVFGASIMICAGIALFIAYSLPKQFRSKAVLNIQSSYFQNPLVNGLITEVTDPQELQAQRLSLLRLALSNSFLDSLANKYSIYSEKVLESEQALTHERNLFADKIEYYSISPTTFEIKVTAGKATVAQKMTSAVLERMKSTLIDERFENLYRTKSAIENHVKTLGDNIQKISTPAGEIAVQSELDRVEATLAGLLMKFTESHPEVQKFRARQRSLQARTKIITSQDSSPSDEVIARGGALAKIPSQEVYSDLLKKLSYLAIVLDMEKDRDNLSYLGVIEQPTYPVSAFFPNKRLFLALGLVVGALAGAFLSIIAELGRKSMLSPIQAANLLDAPLLGELPLLVSTVEINEIKALPETIRTSHKVIAQGA